MSAGARVVYNMSYADGWRADGANVEPWQNKASFAAPAGDGRITLRYRPPYLLAGLGVFAATAFLIARRKIILR